MAVQCKDSNVSKALMNICKADDIRKETELIMKPYANWEEYLMPGPLSIAILGELACISAGQGDFSINKNPPIKGFQYIKYPESFLTCLMQVSNKGWEAFSIAHKNMDKIRMLSMSVPEHMKVLVQTLFQEIEVVGALLPGQLSSMKSISDECKDLAQVVENKFNDEILLIHELLEACLSSKSGYEKELEETKQTLESLKLKQEAAKEAKEAAENYYRSTRTKIDETYQDYRKAVDSIPVGWDAVCKNLVDGLTETLTAVPRLLCNIKSSVFKPTDGDIESDAEPEDDRIAVANICCQSALLVFLGKTITKLVDEEGNIDMSLLYNEKDQTVKTSWTKENAEELLKKIKDEKECSVKDEALEICNFVIDVCHTLDEAVTTKKKDINKGENKGKIKRKIQVLWKKVSNFDSRSKSHTRAPAFSPALPKMAKSQKMMEGSGTMANVHYKIEQTKEMFKITGEEYQRSFENFKKQNEELTEVLIAMRKCSIKEVDFDTARKMLIKGLEALGRVKEQWEKMVCFFQMISSLIESCLSRRISEFLTSTENVQKIANYSSNDFVIDMIYKQAFNASNMAHLVHMISETYTEVSSKYLMDKVSSLGRLITMDPSSPTFNIVRINLADGCDEARKAIEDLVIKKKEEFENNVRARVEKISCELKAVLPEITELEKKAIEDSVQKGMRDLTPDESSQFI